MKNAFRIGTGMPLPLGSTITTKGINFALFSRNATAVTLVVDTNEEGGDWVEIPLDPFRHKTGEVWHILLRNAPTGLRYGYRLAGPHDPT